jgi:hypothetical protein
LGFAGEIHVGEYLFLLSIGQNAIGSFVGQHLMTTPRGTGIQRGQVFGLSALVTGSVFVGIVPSTP